MATSKVANIIPYGEKPEHGMRLVCTRRKVIDLIDVLENDTIHIIGAKDLVLKLKEEMLNGNHDTHIAFYIDFDDVHMLDALRGACFTTTFNTVEDW